jgi:hypothetical protein
MFLSKIFYKTRARITAQLMSYLFHGSSSIGWVSIDLADINLYPYVHVVIKLKDNHFITSGYNLDHEFFLFKNSDCITYGTESYNNYGGYSTATTQKFKGLPIICNNYRYIAYVPKEVVDINIDSSVDNINKWILDNKGTLSDEYTILL